MNIRSKKILQAAEGQSCVNCGANDGTVVAAHYQGYCGHMFGKGKGIKPHDLCIADLCVTCHKQFDAGEGSAYEGFAKKIDLSERFFRCIMKTLVRRCAQGVITTSDIRLGK